ncbi:LruC domain-containing protein [Leptospira perolatii]|uniref:LruC domain-containing protein n=1 Tax=Leptospira perolatii TaxID=2023191 RepID=A0A2M9ZIM3_9LEPT|nr:LruC domain-containing protein [Leptospira perolatii]PJZ68466.1 LruC domain-containing protein [Leptospira perolatii]PJZ71906.1 LruC domain-containing protein [Leptospira perolatii]
MSRITRQTTKLLATLSLVLCVSCSSQQDPAYQWLLGLVDGNPAAPAPTGSQDFGIDIQDETAPVDFVFDTTRTILVNVQVLLDGTTGLPLDGTSVQVTMASSDPSLPSTKTIFSAYTNPNGEVQGSFTVDADTNCVHLRVEAFGKLYEADIDIIKVTKISRRISISFNGNVIELPDTDGDGVPDIADSYPTDPNRVSTIRIPATDYYSIAFEDLYPAQGDSDFNDYVIRAVFEEDLNKYGEVVRVRGRFTHVAKGAAYNHVLKIGLPHAEVANYTLQRISTDGSTVEANLEGTGPAMDSLEVLPSSNTTITSSNASKKNTTFQIGKSAKLEVILSKPISKIALGSAPYDTFIHVINTGKDIHMANRFFDSAGKDLYRDSTGFPWALLIPGNFLWPYERINIRTAYSQFQPWYESLGTTDLDWFRTPNLSDVFPATP